MTANTLTTEGQHVTIIPNTSGIYLDVPDTDYHSQKWAVSSSFLKTMFSDSPYVAKYWDTHSKEDTAAFRFGRAFHTVMTGVGQQPVTKIDGRTKEGKEQKALADAGELLIVTDSEMEALTAMKANLDAHPISESLLKGSEAEVSIFWHDEPSDVWCRIRPDLMHTGQHAIVDLKTVSSHPGPTADGFSKATANFAYDIQAAFYRRGYRATYGVTPVFLFVAVEKTEPFQIGVYELEDAAIDRAEKVVEDLLNDYALYTWFNEWPGIPTETQIIGLPNWATYAREDYLK